MAIHIFCTVCKTSNGLDAKWCSKCGLAFGKKKYRICVSVKGRRFTKVLDNLTLAREAEAAIKADILRGELDICQKVKIAPTLNEVWTKYLPWAKSNKKSWIDDKRYYGKHLAPRFGNRRLDAILPIDIERMKKELREGINKRGKPYAAATIKHQVAILRRLYNLARKWNIYEGKSPVEAVEMPKVDNQLTEFLKDDQLQRLLIVLDNWPFLESAAFVKFALFTGLRRGELFKLTWDDVNFDHGLINLREPKGGKSRTLPISLEALKVLRELDKTSTYIFPGKGGAKRTDFKGPWYRIRKAAGLPESFRFHGLRHHFASTLVSAGIDLPVVQELLGHKDAKTTQRYAHLAPGVVKDAALRSGYLLSPKADQEIDSEVTYG